LRFVHASLSSDPSNQSDIPYILLGCCPSPILSPAPLAFCFEVASTSSFSVQQFSMAKMAREKMKFNSTMAGLNINLVVPVGIIFFMMRIKGVFNMALQLLHGMRLYTRIRYGANFPSDRSGDDIIEKTIANLQLTLVELSDSNPTLYLLKDQLFYSTYDTLVTLAMICTLAYMWSMGYHCAMPLESPSCWVVLLLLSLATFAIQSQLQILYLTGWRARETRYACAVGVTVGVLSMALFSIPTTTSYVDAPTVLAIANHTNAMILQLSPVLGALKLSTMVHLVHFSLSTLLALLTGKGEGGGNR
jgi:hypothetical protein